MKKIKKMLSLILAITLLMANMTTVFAAEPKISTGEPEKHAIEVTIEPNEKYDGIMPLRYDEYDRIVLRGNTIKMDEFYVEERYMAFEAYATDIIGGTVADEIEIELREYVYNGLIANMYLPINGSTYKKDWLDGGRGWYYFSVSNNSNSHINLYLKYYSWK